MSALMVALRRLRSGGFVARKVIPKDIRDEYARLFGRAWEEKLSIPPGTPLHAAKARLGEWLADVETRIASLRAGLRNEGRPLTQRSVFEPWAMPDRITIFQGPHERLARSPEHLLELVSATVWHEIAHYFGMDEAQVRAAERKRRTYRAADEGR